MWIDFDGQLIKIMKVQKRHISLTNTWQIVMTDVLDRDYYKEYNSERERDQAYFEIYQLISTKSLLYKL